MLDLTELTYLVAFKNLGTLTCVSEKFNISTPTITRAMQHLEDEFKVPLFNRGKNKIELNLTGEKAVEHARILLQTADNTLSEVRNFDQSLHTIRVKSCAPMPLWSLIPRLSSSHPSMTISSSVCGTEEVLEAIRSRTCDIGILPFEIKDDSLNVRFYDDETLFICVKKEHELARRKSVSFKDINGFNFLLRSQLGFWDTLCREKMPASRFLVQTDDFEFEELAKNSMLPTFATDKAAIDDYRKNFLLVPITDSEAKVNFYTVTYKDVRLTI